MKQPTETSPHPPVFIAGCGDIGLRVARLEQAEARPVLALSRSASSQQSLSAQGIQAVSGDLDQPASLHVLPLAAAVLYYFAPPPPEGADDRRLAALLSAIAPANRPRRIVYISTSGVYGDCQGAWIDENAPVNPRSERGRRRAAAESCLQAWCQPAGVEAVVLRVPGIYGPGRLPVERIRRGVPVVREDESPWSNRIHADDLAQACFWAARRGKPGGVYNVSDGKPTTMTDYFFRVADLLGLPRPPTITMEQARTLLGSGILSFLEESKRLDNHRLLGDLGLVLRYPDLASGLPACLP